METKICPRCQADKNLDAFYPRNSRGFIPTPCKECRSEVRKIKYRQNPQPTKDKHKRRYEQRKEKHKDYDPYAAGGTKKCPACEEELEVKFFYRVPGNADCLDQHCKLCSRSKASQYKASDKYPGASGVGFNITTKEYWKLYKKQNGVCAICQQPESNGKDLSVDHDASTGKIRGLLCFFHNSGIGKFNHDIALLEQAINYLKENK